VGAVNVDTGVFTTFTNYNTPIEDAPQVAMASSSIPGFFQPRPYEGNLYMDGGTVFNIDASDGVKGCLNRGYAEEDIVVDILILGMHELKPEEDVSRKAVHNARRADQIHRAYAGSNTYRASMLAYPDVYWRNMLVDSYAEYVVPAVDFRNETTWPMQMHGRE